LSKEKKMADKDQVRSEENVTPVEAEVTELDDQNLDEASGGTFENQDEFAANTNNNCLC
jgi:hypothetical protein